MEIISIYYNDKDNIFEDEDGCTEDCVVDIMPYDSMIEGKSNGGTYYFKDVSNPDIAYEVIFPIRDNNRSIYYDIDANMMFDEDGENIFNIFSIIRPNDLYMFKRNRETMEVCGVAGGWVELVWPDCEP